MKKIVILSVTLTAACIAAFASSADFSIRSDPWDHFSPNLRVVNICDLTDTDLNAIMQGEQPETAIEFSAQTTLPITFFLKGDLVNLVEQEGNFGAVEIQQTFYARYIEDNLMLSVNLTDWKPFFEFITGTASVALTLQEGIPSIVFGSETNRRL
ncbi:MAG: hypothetical protein AB7N99_09070 [Simkaniaceae bacterium]